MAVSIRQALHEAAQILPGLDARLEAEVLLAHVLGLTRAQLYARLDDALNPETTARFHALIARRATHEPLAYLTGHREFYGLDFVVDLRVMIPRPETELLVEKALELRCAIRDLRLADVGTGCGCIAVALAVNLPQATVYATELSVEALAVATENVRRHLDVAPSVYPCLSVDRVRLLCGDLLAPLPEAVDLIVANLPYVTTAEWENLPPEIHDFEPNIALDGGEDGLEQIRRLLAQAPTYLKPGGAILLEIGVGQAPAVASLARRHFPTASLTLAKDLAELERVVIIQP
jgi:release factor glutamine methyltransferase